MESGFSQRELLRTEYPRTMFLTGGRDILVLPRWAYRCMESGVSLPRTREILTKYSFCWRSIYANGPPTTTGRPPLIPHVRDIRPHDSLFIYFAADSEDELLGAFLVRTPVSAVGLDGVTALGIVNDPELEAALSGDETYPRDPVLNAYTGFFIEKDKYPKPPTKPPTFHRNAIVALREGA